MGRVNPGTVQGVLGQPVVRPVETHFKLEKNQGQSRSSWEEFRRLSFACVVNVSPSAWFLSRATLVSVGVSPVAGFTPGLRQAFLEERPASSRPPPRP